MFRWRSLLLTSLARATTAFALQSLFREGESRPRRGFAISGPCRWATEYSLFPTRYNGRAKDRKVLCVSFRGPSICQAARHIMYHCYVMP
ncbi:hypothetical protein B0H34DRAFT_258072 [Crassisporium funariophilum]|nr:hypothetical protein B0H34DRAFT_258072 [Crassisporium funariophilum]